MNIEKEVMEDKARLRMLELRYKALINILKNEGIVIEEEVEQELNNIIKLGTEEEHG